MLSPGVRLGPYEIVGSLGAGGMGEVYQAIDTRLDRTVAIKVLPEHVASDSELRQRFEREAKTLAALNHPHICHIHDVGRHPSAGSGQGVDFLVMEYLEGETLAQRLAKGALPLDQALQVAIQIAEAFDKAHRKGIVHRDLKPGNIMLTKSGVGSAGSPQAKLLDFGLAKLRPTTVVGGVVPGEAPTVSSPITGAGTILGTLQYMAPEQLEGQEADARTDIFAFGAVVYEMVTGKKAFEGKSQASLTAAILERDPAPMSSLQPVSPPTLDRVVKKCLAKSADDRWQSAKDLRDELVWIASDGTDAGVGVPVAAPRRVAGWRLGLAWLGVFCAGLAVAGAINWVAMRDEVPAVARVEVTTPAEAALSLDQNQRNIAMAPDGSRIVYRGQDGAGNFALFVRALAQLSPTVLTVEDARAPFMSPDGQWVGFFTGEGRLWKVAITGGPAASVVGLDGNQVRGATWGEDGTIIYATGNRDTGLQRVSADGGTVEVLTRPDPAKGEADHFWPELLPGGQAVLFTIWPPSGGTDNAQVAVLDLRTGDQRVLVRGGSDARYISPGHLVFGAGGGLRSVPFDLQRLTVTGTPVPVVEGVATSANGSAECAISRNGSLIYVAARTARRELVWVDRQGNEEALGAAPRAYTRARVSPDNSRVALEVRDEERDLWVWDVGQRLLSRTTFDPNTDSDPVWTPDGRRLIFTSGADRSSTSRSVYAIQADGSGVSSLLLRAGAVGKYPETVTQDGRRVIYVERATTGDWDLMQLLLPPAGEALPSSPPAPTVLLKTAFNEINSRLSPTNQWMVYQSDESGRYEAYVRPYPDVQAGRFQISTEGARLARWSRDGRELFYVSLDNILMAVRVEPGPVWRASPPARVISMEPYLTAFDTDFDVSSDGQRFLVIKEEAGTALVARNLVVVQHFAEELKRLVPVN